MPTSLTRHTFGWGHFKVNGQDIGDCQLELIQHIETIEYHELRGYIRSLGDSMMWYSVEITFEGDFAHTGLLNVGEPFGFEFSSGGHTLHGRGAHLRPLQTFIATTDGLWTVKIEFRIEENQDEQPNLSIITNEAENEYDAEVVTQDILDAKEAWEPPKHVRRIRTK